MMYIKRILILTMVSGVLMGCIIVPPPNHHPVKCTKSWHGDRGCAHYGYK